MSYGKPNFMLRSKDIDPAELANLVPYVGANQNVNLGELGMSADFVDLNNPSIAGYGEGQLAWDTPEGTATFTTVVTSTTYGEQNFNVHIGQQDFFVGISTFDTGSILTGVAVQATLAGVVSEYRLLVSPVSQQTQQNCIVGLVKNQAVDDDTIYVQTYGMFFNINTLAWNVGDPLYALTDGIGSLTNVLPTTPLVPVIFIGTVVVKANEKTGSVFLSPKVFYSFSQFSDVYLPDVMNGDNLYYDRDNLRWTSKQRNISVQAQVQPLQVH